MSDLERLQDAFLKADKLAQQGNAQAAEDAALFAAEIRKVQSGAAPRPTQNDRVMSQFNAGVAEVAGGLADLINPFDKHTGSAREALPRIMNNAGIATATDQPEGMGENFMRGAGSAMAAVVPATKAAQALSVAPGLVGRASGELARGMTAGPALAIEPVMGGVSRMAGQLTEDAGYPEWRDTAEMLAPMGVGVGAMATGPVARGALNAGKKVPGVSTAINLGEAAAGAVAPMTYAGARQVARNELVQRAGTEERLKHLGKQIELETELDLTPAQQIGDEEILALEQSAKSENPNLRERLETRDAAGREKAQSQIEGLGSDVNDARLFFAQRRLQYRKNMQEQISRVVRNAQEVGHGRGPRNTETNNSERVVEKLKKSLAENLEIEREMWAAVPNDALVSPFYAKGTAEDLLNELPRAQSNDFPNIAQELLLKGGGFGDLETVSELHGLYSELRRVARSAMAGNDQNKNKARVANEIADAILRDLEGADSLPDGVGRTITDAREFSRVLHEMFDQGTVGAILNRTIDGDERINPQVALKRTIGRGGSDAKVANDEILRASPDAQGEIMDFTRRDFSNKLFNSEGEFTSKAALDWMRDNAEFLGKNPNFKSEFERATKDAKFAQAFRERGEIRLKLQDENSLARFNSGQKAQAVNSIIKASDPVQAAKTIRNAAAKDRTGAALAGVKGAFSRYLIDSALLNEQITAKGLQSLLREGEIADAARTIYSDRDLTQLNLLMGQLSKMDAARSASARGPSVDAAPQRIVETVAAVAGAKAGAAFGQGMGGVSNAGTSLQAAARGSSFATNLLDRLTNEKARKILHDAVEDPQLMRALMLDESVPQLPKWARNKLIPYLEAGAAQQLGEDDAGQ